MKKIIRDIKIKCNERKVVKLTKTIVMCEHALVCNSTMMVDVPKYKKMKKEAEATLTQVYDELYKLRMQNIGDCIAFFKKC